MAIFEVYDRRSDVHFLTIEAKASSLSRVYLPDRIVAAKDLARRLWRIHVETGKSIEDCAKSISPNLGIRAIAAPLAGETPINPTTLAYGSKVSA